MNSYENWGITFVCPTFSVEIVELSMQGFNWQLKWLHRTARPATHSTAFMMFANVYDICPIMSTVAGSAFSAQKPVATTSLSNYTRLQSFRLCWVCSFCTSTISTRLTPCAPSCPVWTKQLSLEFFQNERHPNLLHININMWNCGFMAVNVDL